MDNLCIYNKCRSVPAIALKPIAGGRLKGKSDINPMWRIKQLTENFGPCGIGWKYEILEQRLEKGYENEIAAFVKINLYYKWEGQWSEAIPGTGGSSFVTKENSGTIFVSDECFKMALTDAISVACKALGIGADVYWDKDQTKYGKSSEEDEQKDDKQKQASISDAQVKRAYAIAKSNNISEDALKQWIKTKLGKDSMKILTKKEYDELCEALEKPKKKPES